MLSELEQYLQRNLNEAQEQRFLAEEKVKTMEEALNRIITSVNHRWYKNIGEIAREALKDD